MKTFANIVALVAVLLIIGGVFMLSTIAGMIVAGVFLFLWAMAIYYEADKK